MDTPQAPPVPSVEEFIGEAVDGLMLDQFPLDPEKLDEIMDRVRANAELTHGLHAGAANRTDEENSELAYQCAQDFIRIIMLHPDADKIIWEMFARTQAQVAEMSAALAGAYQLIGAMGRGE